MQGLIRLRALVADVPARLEQHPADKIEPKPAPSKWSPKEEPGRLPDSPANYHPRRVRTLRQDRPAMPGYDGDRWVGLHAYQERDWREGIELWRALSLEAVAAAHREPGCERARWPVLVHGRSSLSLTIIFGTWCIISSPSRFWVDALEL